jgi:hypothetical protein
VVMKTKDSNVVRELFYRPSDIGETSPIRRSPFRPTPLWTSDDMAAVYRLLYCDRSPPGRGYDGAYVQVDHQTNRTVAVRQYVPTSLG